MLNRLQFAWFNKHHQWTDDALISAYKNSNAQEYVAELFGRYIELVYGVALKYTKNDKDAEDITFEIFGIMVKKLQFHEVDNFKSWLYRTVTNYCIDVVRKSNKDIVVSLDTSNIVVKQMGYEFENENEDKEVMLRKIELCLKKLTKEQKECIELFYFKEESYHNISDKLKISWTKTRSYIQNGKRNLKICMESQ